MSNKPLTYFTVLSVAAHAALFGLWPSSEQSVANQQESSIEIGLVSMPKVDPDFTTEKNSSSTASIQTTTEATPQLEDSRPDTRQQQTTAPLMNSAQELEPATEDELTLPTPVGASQPVTDTSKTSPGNSPAVAVEAAPLYAKNPAPVYPADALRYGWEGEVWLKVDVSRTGRVSDVSIDRSSGYPLLDRAAVRTVRKWQFEPARVGQETVDGTVRVPVRFKIRRT